MVIDCLVPGCKNFSRSKPNLHFHGFPFGDELRLKQWIHALRRKNWTATKNSRICSEHFTQNDYIAPLFVKLKSNAVPSLLLPVVCVHTHEEEKLEFPHKIKIPRLSQGDIPGIFPGRSIIGKVHENINNVETPAPFEFINCDPASAAQVHDVNINEIKTEYIEPEPSPEICQTEYTEPESAPSPEFIKTEFKVSEYTSSSIICKTELNETESAPSLDFNFDLLWISPELVELPQSTWNWHKIATDVYEFVIFTNLTLSAKTGLPIIERQFIVGKQLGIKVSIGNIEISTWKPSIDKLNSFDDVTKALKEFSLLRICHGGPKTSLYPTAKIKTSLADIDGDTDRWRHKNCSRICTLLTVCNNCSNLARNYDKQIIRKQHLPDQDLNIDLPNQDLNIDLPKQDPNINLINQDLFNQDLLNEHLRNKDLRNENLRNEDLPNKDLNIDLPNQDLLSKDPTVLLDSYTEFKKKSLKTQNRLRKKIKNLKKNVKVLKYKILNMPEYQNQVISNTRLNIECNSKTNNSGNGSDRVNISDEMNFSDSDDSDISSDSEDIMA